MSVNGRENGSIVYIEEGQNLVKVTVEHENGQSCTYSLNVTGTQAASVSFDAPADTTYEVYTQSGTCLNQGVNGSYALVPGAQYYYISTKEDFFHATQNFTASDGLLMHVIEPETEDGLEGFCLYDNSSPKYREEYIPENTFSSSIHICDYDVPAYAQSIYGLQKNENEEPHLFIGKTDGEIVSPKGDNNFGWDPCFKPNYSKKTYAEMDENEKNKISHRGKSTKAMIDWIKDNLDIF